MSDFEPRIVGFLCNWCSYAGADAAGNRKMEHPPNFNVIRVMCSGRVDPQMVLKAFAEGADAVAIFGCHFGDCHYKKGNWNAYARYKMLKKLLPDLGIDPDRFHLEWISASESEKYVTKVTEIVEKTRTMGPIPQEKSGGSIPGVA